MTERETVKYQVKLQTDTFRKFNTDHRSMQNTHLPKLSFPVITNNISCEFIIRNLPAIHITVI